MFKKLLVISLVLMLLLTACAPKATPTEAPPPEVEKTEAPPVKTEAPEPPPVSGEVVKATPGNALKMVLLPKFLGNAVFDQAHEGAKEAAAELQNPEVVQFLGPTPENSVTGQIEIVTNSTTQGVDAIMLSNNAGDQIAPAAQAARDAGITFVTWDSPIPSAEGEQVFVAQVDFDEPAW